MEDEMLKVNILTITASGFLMLLTGLLLYIFKVSSPGTFASSCRFLPSESRPTFSCSTCLDITMPNYPAISGTRCVN